MKFNYVKLPLKLEHGPFRQTFIQLPLIQVYFQLKNGGRLQYFCLVDSGSDYCFFSNEVAKNLNLDLARAKQVEARGVTGHIFKAYFLPVTFTVGGWDCTVNAGFSSDLGTPYGILGRQGFFESFRVCIDEKLKEIELKQRWESDS